MSTEKSPTDARHLVERYFRAAPMADRDAYLDLFAEDAVAEDEGRRHHGRAAIAAWRGDVPPVTYDVREVSEQDGRTIAVARIEGDFPRSPVDLTFDFRFDGAGLVEELSIRP